tara:strand:- start:72 stop:227 length:156 start_codon:yes stop_codon:yes gene_type:complete
LRFQKWKENCFSFLISCALKDFRINLKACKLKKFELEQFMGRLKQRVRILQ